MAPHYETIDGTRIPETQHATGAFEPHASAVQKAAKYPGAREVEDGQGEACATHTEKTPGNQEIGHTDLLSDIALLSQIAHMQ